MTQTKDNKADDNAATQATGNYADNNDADVDVDAVTKTTR